MTSVNLQEQARALGDPTRHAIFRHLATVARPIGIAELNDEFPFNHNAIRQHLAKLVAADLVLESRSTARGRGRPKLLYEVNPAVEAQWGSTGPYERLSRLLVEVIRTGLEPEEVGRQCADMFRVASPSGDVVADVAAAMARQGFEPEVRAVRGGAEIVLERCPFASAAVTDRNTVCALHLGIAEGLANGGPGVVRELVGYDPRRAGCRLRLETSSEASGERSRGTLSLRRSPPRR